MEADCSETNNWTQSKTNVILTNKREVGGIIDCKKTKKNKKITKLVDVVWLAFAFPR